MSKTPSGPRGKEAVGSSEPFPFPTAERHPAPPPEAFPVTEEPTEDALDHGIEESFPASDPVSVSVTKAVPKTPDEEAGGGSPGQGA